jgi:ADP-ribose pyrophosphatase
MAKDDAEQGQGRSGGDLGEGALDPGRVSALRFPLIDRFDGEDHKVFRTASELRRHPGSGRLHRYSLLLCPHWVNVIARTSEGRYIFIHQWRAGTDEVTLEIPGGMVDPGEPALKAAHRELMEETGYKGSKGEVIGVVHPNPALQNNQCTTVLVEGCAQAAQPTPDAGELIEVCNLSADEVRAALKQGHIRHALVVAAFAHLLLKDSL